MKAGRQKRVIVLGGGVAGLAAAHELRRLAPNIELHLIEARQQLGGRILTERDALSGEPLELGAEFVHGRPPDLLRVLRQARIAIDEGDDRGEPESSPFALLPKLLAPFLASEAPDRAIGDFLSQQAISAGQREMLRGYVQGFYLAAPDRASTRAIARMEVAARAIHGGRAAQVPGGYEALVHWLAKQLQPTELRLGAAASSVSWKPGHVEVQATSLASARLPRFEGDAAIIALPFHALGGRAGSLKLSPALAEKQRAAASLRMGYATKVFLRFDDSVKTEAFFFGGGRVPVWWTAAAPQTRWLVGWAGGRAAEVLDRLSDGAIRQAALRSIAIPTGQKLTALARALTGFRCVHWSREPFIEGAYAVVPLGADGAMDVLATPVAGTLYFAGEATHPEHAGTVHGAFESGVRAARELLADL
jgi:monoamine oxidase